MAKLNQNQLKQKHGLISCPLFKIEFKSNLKNLLTNCATLILLIGVFLSLYPMMSNVYAKMAENLPAGFEGIMGRLTINNIGEYFSVQTLSFWLMLVGVFSAILGVNMINKDYKNGSVEMLYSLNLSRRKIYRTKLSVAVLHSVIYNAVALGTSFAGLLMFGKGSMFSVGNLFVVGLFSTLITIQMVVIFFALGAIFKSKLSTWVVIAAVLLLYTISSLYMLNDKVAFLAYLYPFTAIDTNIMVNGFRGINYIIFGIWSGISVIMLIYSYMRFKNSDV